LGQAIHFCRRKQNCNFDLRSATGSRVRLSGPRPDGRRVPRPAATASNAGPSSAGRRMTRRCSTTVDSSQVDSGGPMLQIKFYNFSAVPTYAVNATKALFLF
jgi:hypothetical protein